MAVVVSGVAVFVTALFGFFTARRSQYDRVLNVIDHISSSEVAAARHNLGTIIYDPSDPVVMTNARTQDLFTVLWAFNRINAVRLTLPCWRTSRLLKIDGPHRLLKQSTSSWVSFWWQNIDLISVQLGASPEGSRNGLEELADHWL